MVCVKPARSWVFGVLDVNVGSQRRVGLYGFGGDGLYFSILPLFLLSLLRLGF